MATLRTMLGLALHPERRRSGVRPLQVDLRRVILLGLAVWLVAMVVCTVLGTTAAAGTTQQLWVCGAGLALGGAGLLWERTHRRSYRDAAETDDVDEVDTSAGPASPGAR